jgi:hypothetical protein
VTCPTRCPGRARSSTRGRKQRYPPGAGNKAVGARTTTSHGDARRRRLLLCRAGRGEFSLPGVSDNSDKTSPFPIYQNLPAAITMTAARRTLIAKTLTPKDWLASNGYLTSCRTRRRRRQLFCNDLRGCDPFDADHDSAAGIRHPHQHHPDRLGDPDPQLSDAVAARGAAAAERFRRAFAIPRTALRKRRERKLSPERAKRNPGLAPPDAKSLVVPANAGTHNHRRVLEQKPLATVPRCEAAAYGSLLSQGRRTIWRVRAPSISQIQISNSAFVPKHGFAISPRSHASSALDVAPP